MSDKRKIHHYYRLFRYISFWHFLTLTIIFGVISVLSLRQNNLTAINLRDKVLQVDEENGDVDSALKELRSFVHSHMNTSLNTGTSVYPPIQLKYRYERLKAIEQERVNKINGNIYEEAQKVCEQRFPAGFSGSGRIPCIQEYVTSHGGAAPNPIPDALYKFDFASPKWSPDLAGWTLLAAMFFGLLTILRLSLSLWFRAILKEH